MRLRSVELELPRAREAQQFFTGVWGLLDAGSAGERSFLRATGDHPYVIALTESRRPGLDSVTFGAGAAELEALATRARAAGAVVEGPAQYDEPGAPSGYVVQGREGQRFRFVCDRDRPAALPADRDRPLWLTHAVLNVRDREASTRFAVEALGFKLSDRSRSMDFVRCDATHHAVAFADSGTSALNHLAFEMVSLDGVMRGIGRMKDHGYACVWGPGRHGPGNNVFGYFVSPFGAVIEYTSEVQRLDDSYRTGGPEDWSWPSDRTDQWGITGRDLRRMDEAGTLFAWQKAA